MGEGFGIYRLRLSGNRIFNRRRRETIARRGKTSLMPAYGILGNECEKGRAFGKWLHLQVY